MSASVAAFMAVACSSGSGEGPRDAGYGGRGDDGPVGVVGSGGGGRYPPSDGGDAANDVESGALDDASPGSDAAGGSSGGGSGGSGSGGSGSSSGSGASSSGSGSSSSGSGSSSGASDSGAQAAHDAGVDGSVGVRDASAPDGDASIGIVIGVGTSVSLSSLEWILTGPNTYFGTVDFGDAAFAEFVIGGVVAGSGYTITLLGKDTAGDPCRGMSSPFNVQPGELSGASVVVSCTFASDAALDAP